MCFYPINYSLCYGIFTTKKHNYSKLSVYDRSGFRDLLNLHTGHSVLVKISVSFDKTAFALSFCWKNTQRANLFEIFLNEPSCAIIRRQFHWKLKLSFHHRSFSLPNRQLVVITLFVWLCQVLPVVAIWARFIKMIAYIRLDMPGKCTDIYVKNIVIFESGAFESQTIDIHDDFYSF